MPSSSSTCTRRRALSGSRHARIWLGQSRKKSSRWTKMPLKNSSYRRQEQETRRRQDFSWILHSKIASSSHRSEACTQRKNSNLFSHSQRPTVRSRKKQQVGRKGVFWSIFPLQTSQRICMLVTSDRQSKEIASAGSSNSWDMTSNAWITLETGEPSLECLLPNWMTTSRISLTASRPQASHQARNNRRHNHLQSMILRLS